MGFFERNFGKFLKGFCGKEIEGGLMNSAEKVGREVWSVG